MTQEEIGEAIKNETGYGSKFSVEAYIKNVRAFESIKEVEFGQKSVFYGRFSGFIQKGNTDMVLFHEESNNFDLIGNTPMSEFITLESLIFKEKITVNWLNSASHSVQGFIEGWLFKFE